MKKITNNILFIVSVLISIGLIMLWIGASIFFLNKSNLTLINIKTLNNLPYKTSQITVDNQNAYSGMFNSIDNNLGVITVSLNPIKVLTINSGRIKFRFKEANDKNWEYVSEYDIKLFDSQTEFSFGIPVIKNSINKKYTFEISNNNIESSVIIKNPNLFTIGYKYSKEELKSNKLILIHFAVNKFLSDFSNINFIFRSLLFLLPFFAFLIILWILKHASKFKKCIKPLIFAFLLFEFVFPSTLNIDSSIIFVISWIVVCFLFKLNSKISLSLSFILIIFWLIIIPFGFSSLQYKLNILVYGIFAIGVIQLLIEERDKK